MACYIMTIGVIDECRQLGIGTSLLKQTIQLVEAKYKTCLAIYLHVVDYNRTALKFYKRNGFINLKTLYNHYEIHGADYDAIVLYKPIGDTKKVILEKKAELKHLER